MVKRIESYGVFVTLGTSKTTGLCHISEAAEEFVTDLTELYTPGDLVKVVILKLDAEV